MTQDIKYIQRSKEVKISDNFWFYFMYNLINVAILGSTKIVKTYSCRSHLIKTIVEIIK